MFLPESGSKKVATDKMIKDFDSEYIIFQSVPSLLPSQVNYCVGRKLNINLYCIKAFDLVS
jgi:hypothetical protein